MKFLKEIAGFAFTFALVIGVLALAWDMIVHYHHLLM